MVVIEDDGKGKHQSIRARCSLEQIGGKGSHSFEIVGWGASVDEACRNYEVERAKVLEWINAASSFRPDANT